MTTTVAKSSNASLPIGIPPATTGSSGAQVLWREFSIEKPLPLPNTKSLNTVLARYESDPAKAVLMAAARKKVSGEMYKDELNTLSALRLAAGLSQAQLAELAHTTQPYIARIERGQTDPGTNMIARIAAALKVDEATTYKAIRNQVKTRGQTA